MIKPRMQIAVCVALGSGLGGMLRVGVAAIAVTAFGGHFPFGILTVNVLGSFAIGLAATLTAPDGRLFAGPVARQFLMAGFCGGFTTFSFFSLQTMLLLEQGRYIAAFLYSFFTLALSMLAVWLGHATGSRANRFASRE